MAISTVAYGFSMPDELRPRRGRPPGAYGASTRRRILRGARRVFSEKGFERASMEQIARSAGITRTGIGNYFASKADVYRACFESVQREAIQIIMQDTPDSSRPASERLVGLFEAAVRYSNPDDTLVRFWVTSIIDMTRSSDLSSRPDSDFFELRTYFANCIRDGIDAGEFSPALVPAQAAQLFVDLLFGIAIDLGFYATPGRIDGVLATLRSLVDGLRVSRSLDVTP